MRDHTEQLESIHALEQQCENLGRQVDACIAEGKRQLSVAERLQEQRRGLRSKIEALLGTPANV